LLRYSGSLSKAFTAPVVWIAENRRLKKRGRDAKWGWVEFAEPASAVANDRLYRGQRRDVPSDEQSWVCGRVALSGPIELQGAPKGASVLILGAGMAGMTAAYELRSAGYKVQVLEYNGRPGGRN